MKIAQVICTFPPYKGGMGNSVYHFSRELAKLGHEVTVFTPLYSNQSCQPDYDCPDFEVVRLKPLLSHGNSAILPQLPWRLKDFDIVQLHYPFYGTALSVSLVRLFRPSMKLCVYYHMDNKARGFKGLVFQLYRFLVLPVILRLADEIACSSFDYVSHSEARGYYGKHAQKFNSVSYGVDTELFRPGLGREDKGGKEILFVGALIKQGCFKGLDILFSAFKRVRNQIDDCLLRIVGQGDMEQYYRDLAGTLDIGEDVDFVTDADDKDLVGCYQSCDMLVLPSVDSSEAFGIVLLEAMACGKPVVASDLPGVRSVFKNGEHGLLAVPGDVKDLAKKISAILQDEKAAEQYGKAGYDLVKAEYTWERAAEKLNAIYERLQRGSICTEKV